MQIIENWTDIKGAVERLEGSSRHSDFTTVFVRVEESRDVPGFKNLLREISGRTLDVLIPTSICNELPIRPGSRIACRVRMAGGRQHFVHRHHVDLVAEGDVE